jgi:hypothetical protein
MTNGSRRGFATHLIQVLVSRRTRAWIYDHQKQAESHLFRNFSSSDRKFAERTGNALILGLG